MLNRKFFQLSVLMYLFLSADIFAEDDGVTKLITNPKGLVDIPIEGNDSFWIILNECRADRWGHSQSGSSITYKPLNYGDLFFFEQFTGDTAKFVEEVALLRLIRRPGCEFSDRYYFKADGPTWDEKIKSSPPNVDSHTIAQAIIDSFIELSKFDSTLTAPQVIARFPTKSSPACPSTLSTASIQSLANCLDANKINNLLLNKLLVIHSNNNLGLTGFESSRYQVRKPFSSGTISAGVAAYTNGGAMMTTQYISIFPGTLFPGEGRVFWDRVSVDLGIAQAMSGTSTEKLESAKKHYLFGLGFHATSSFSINLSNIRSYYDEGENEDDFAIGVSLDLLKAFDSIK